MNLFLKGMIDQVLRVSQIEKAFRPPKLSKTDFRVNGSDPTLCPDVRDSDTESMDDGTKMLENSPVSDQDDDNKLGDDSQAVSAWDPDQLAGTVDACEPKRDCLMALPELPCSSFSAIIDSKMTDWRATGLKDFVLCDDELVNLERQPRRAPTTHSLMTCQQIASMTSRLVEGHALLGQWS